MPSDSDVLPIICEGGNEYTAWLLLTHFVRVGLVKRFKFQPFNLSDYGGPKGFPDLMIELSDGLLVIVEVKSNKYITAEFIQTHRARQASLQSMGLPCVLWTDAKAQLAIPALIRNIRNNLCDFDRCKDLPLERDLLARFRELTMHGPSSLAALIDQSGAHWEKVMCALALNHISTKIEETIHETSLIYPPAAPRMYEHFFSQGPGSESWWRRLPNLDLDINGSGS